METTFISVEEHKKELEKAVTAEREKLMAISMQTILSICHMIDARDSDTQEHSQRVAKYSCMIARKMGWPDARVKMLENMALLHDIGKVGVKDGILHKPSELTDDEFNTMKDHTIIGASILEELLFIPGVSIGAKCHHERYDGNGYPYGLKGDEIPVEARIIGIADAFDAMNSRRIYAEKSEKEYIIRELKNGRGTQFDPYILDVFLEVLENNIFNVKGSS